MTRLQGPTAFLLGAPKCGTTAIAQYLSETPGVCMSDPKEPNFFCTDIHPYDRGFTSYDDYVGRCFGHQEPGDKARVDATVWNLYSRDAVPAILDIQPEARFIVMLRNPVDMALSLYSHRCDNGLETRRDFQTAFNQSIGERGFIDGSSMVNNIDYSDLCKLGAQVERLLSVTGRENILFGFLDDLRNRPEWLWKRICEHVGIDPGDRREFSPVNIRHGIPRRTFGVPFRAHAIRLIGSPPAPIMKLRNALVACLPIKGFGTMRHRRRLQSAMRQDGHRADATPGFVRELNDLFQEDVRLLERCTGRDLTAWSRSGPGTHD